MAAPINPPVYNLVQVKVSNGGMDREATLCLKRGRRVVELRARCSTSFMGRLRHEFEAFLWTGPGRHTGTTLIRETFEISLKGVFDMPPWKDLKKVAAFGAADDDVRENRDRVTTACRFTTNEFLAARRGPVVEDVPEFKITSDTILNRPGEDLIETVRAARRTRS